MAYTHNLKILPPYFEALASGKKTFELRYNDSGFKEGDTLILNEYDSALEQYTGRNIWFKVGYILYSFEGIDLQGWVIISLLPLLD